MLVLVLLLQEVLQLQLVWLALTFLGGPLPMALAIVLQM
jgi:hypothetical protein